MKTGLWVLLSLSISFLLFVTGCRENAAVGPGSDRTAQGSVSITVPRAPAAVARVVATLTRIGFPDRVLDLTITDPGGSAGGSFSDVAAGAWWLQVNALDGAGILKYSGEDHVEVFPNETSEVTLELAPPGTIEIIVVWGGSCIPPPEGLVSWWAGEGNPGDIVGPNNGILKNGTRFWRGKVGRAFEFDGMDDLVLVPASPSLQPRASFTIEAWIYPTEDRDGNIFSQWQDDVTLVNQRAYQLGMRVGGKLRFAISDSAHQRDPAFHVFDTDSSVLAFNRWNHVAAVYDQGTGARRIYVDGRLVGERIDTPITIQRSAADVTVGAILYPEWNFYYAYFKGRIDELAWYDRALTEAQVRDIFRAGSAGKCRPEGTRVSAESPRTR